MSPFDKRLHQIENARNRAEFTLSLGVSKNYADFVFLQKNLWGLEYARRNQSFELH